MRNDAADIAHQLARNAEAVCRYYLGNGRKQGRYWLVGDVDNTPGRSLFVRLSGPDSGKGAAGKWTDAATGEHGDLLDLIAANQRLDTFKHVLDEARQFLSLPREDHRPAQPVQPTVPSGSPEAAQRLFAIGHPISGTLAQTYLRQRGITHFGGLSALRFHPRCFYRTDDQAPLEKWPALLAAVTDLDGVITGVHRTWLARDGSDKAPLATPRRAMGNLLGQGVRIGTPTDVLTVGEGIETMLSLRCVLPNLPMVAALSSAHLANVILPSTVRRLYIAVDNDHAGRLALSELSARARGCNIDVLPLIPSADDFNTDLRALRQDRLAAALRPQIAPEDVIRFLQVSPRTQ